MTKGHLIIGMRLKLVGETKSIIIFTPFTRAIIVHEIAIKVVLLDNFRRPILVIIPINVVHRVGYVITATKPLGAILLMLTLRVDNRLHTNLI